MVGREICFGCRKPKRRADWHCHRCHKLLLKSIAASKRRKARQST
jgi:hypothetical protein